MEETALMGGKEMGWSLLKTPFRGREEKLLAMKGSQEGEEGKVQLLETGCRDENLFKVPRRAHRGLGEGRHPRPVIRELSSSGLPPLPAQQLSSA